MKSAAKIFIVSLLAGSSFFINSAFANSLGVCQFGTPCVLSPDRAIVYTVTPTIGVNYSCVVTADSTAITLIVKDAGKYKITSGAGSHEANPTVTIDIKGLFESKQGKVKGKIIFNDVAGGSGTVTCQPVV